MISVTRPLTGKALDLIQQTLNIHAGGAYPGGPGNDTTTAFDSPTISSNNHHHHQGSHADAVVLIPFCNVGWRPGILLEVRDHILRSHSGEISFPGGKADKDGCIP